MRMIKSLVRKINKQIQYQNMRKIYRRFHDFTMIPETTYINNLILAGKITNIEGSIVECGVWRGGMIAGIASLLGNERKYYLFDSFEGLPNVEEVDGEAALRWQSDIKSPTYHNNCSAPKELAEKAMKLSGVTQYFISKGWFEDTLPTFDKNSAIALLRLDGDWYKSTKICLDTLFDLVVTGGVIILDDYYAWDGCSRALHDFLSENKVKERISCLSGICYLVKQ